MLELVSSQEDTRQWCLSVPPSPPPPSSKYLVREKKLDSEVGVESQWSLEPLGQARVWESVGSELDRKLREGFDQKAYKQD